MLKVIVKENPIVKSIVDKGVSLNMRHVNLAAHAQEKSFEDKTILIDRAKKDSNNILLSGGYFLNCSNNFKYVKNRCLNFLYLVKLKK